MTLDAVMRASGTTANGVSSDAAPAGVAPGHEIAQKPAGAPAAAVVKP
jgi:hypothetical protein